MSGCLLLRYLVYTEYKNISVMPDLTWKRGQPRGDRFPNADSEWSYRTLCDGGGLLSVKYILGHDKATSNSLMHFPKACKEVNMEQLVTFPTRVRVKPGTVLTNVGK